MSEFTLPSGRASIETEGGPLSEINYRYPATGKDKTIQEALEECWRLNAVLDEAIAILKINAADYGKQHTRWCQSKGRGAVSGRNVTKALQKLCESLAEQYARNRGESDDNSL